MSFESFSWLDLMWSGWVAFYDYFTEIEVLNDGKFQQYKKHLEAGGTFTVLFEGIAITSNRPVFVRQDDESRLHCDQGPAIKWRDGFELYFLDGVELSAELHEEIASNTMTFERILTIEDSDVRAVALKYNKNAIIASGAELIDEHPTAGELFLIEKKEINKILDEPRLYFLRMKCPTGRTFVEAVEPNYAQANPYALHCQAKAWGISPDIYGQLRHEG